MLDTATETQRSGWYYYFLYRQESFRATWKLRFFIFVLAAIGAWITRDFWTLKLGESLVCQEHLSPSDAVILENLQENDSVFKSTAVLQKMGITDRVLVPVPATDDEMPYTVSEGIADVISQRWHLSNIQLIPVSGSEPISLGSAYQVRDFLAKKRISSVIVAARGFRSRRLFLIYNAILRPAHITVGCVPVFVGMTASNWKRTSHGVQEVGVQFLKLEYYRLFGLR